jgi:hypothetical protein
MMYPAGVHWNVARRGSGLGQANATRREYMRPQTLVPLGLLMLVIGACSPPEAARAERRGSRCDAGIRPLALHDMGPLDEIGIVGSWQGRVLLVGDRTLLASLTEAEVQRASEAIREEVSRSRVSFMQEDLPADLRAKVVAAINDRIGREVLTDVWIWLWPSEAGEPRGRG